MSVDCCLSRQHVACRPPCCVKEPFEERDRDNEAFQCCTRLLRCTHFGKAYPSTQCVQAGAIGDYENSCTRQNVHSQKEHCRETVAIPLIHDGALRRGPLQTDSRHLSDTRCTLRRGPQAQNTMIRAESQLHRVQLLPCIPVTGCMRHGGEKGTYKSDMIPALKSQRRHALPKDAARTRSMEQSHLVSLAAGRARRSKSLLCVGRKTERDRQDGQVLGEGEVARGRGVDAA